MCFTLKQVRRSASSARISGGPDRDLRFSFIASTYTSPMPPAPSGARIFTCRVVVRPAASQALLSSWAPACSPRLSTQAGREILNPARQPQSAARHHSECVISTAGSCERAAFTRRPLQRHDRSAQRAAILHSFLSAFLSELNQPRSPGSIRVSRSAKRFSTLQPFPRPSARQNLN